MVAIAVITLVLSLHFNSYFIYYILFFHPSSPHVQNLCCKAETCKLLAITYYILNTRTLAICIAMRSTNINWFSFSVHAYSRRNGIYIVPIAIMHAHSITAICFLFLFFFLFFCITMSMFRHFLGRDTHKKMQSMFHFHLKTKMLPLQLQLKLKWIRSEKNLDCLSKVECRRVLVKYLSCFFR